MGATMARRRLPARSAAAPRGWHRPVRPVALVVVGGAVLLLWLALMLAATWYVYARWEAVIDLRHQPVQLRLPAGMNALAEVQAPLHTRLDIVPRVKVPLRQALSAEVSDSLQAQVQLRTVVPVATRVRVEQTVPVNTSLQLSVPVLSWLPRFEVAVPLTVAVPVRLDLPVRLEVPLALDAHVSGELRAPLQVPLDMVLDLRPEVHADVAVTVSRQMAFRLLGPMPPMPLHIEQASLRLPFSQPRLRQREAGP